MSPFNSVGQPFVLKSLIEADRSYAALNQALKSAREHLSLFARFTDSGAANLKQERAGVQENHKMIAFTQPSNDNVVHIQ